MLAAQSALLAALTLPDGSTRGGGRPGTWRQLEALLVSVTSLSEGVCAEVVSCLFFKIKFVCLCLCWVFVAVWASLQLRWVGASLLFWGFGVRVAHVGGFF